MHVEQPSYCFNKSNILITSIYSDSLYVFNTNSGFISNTVPLISNFSKIGLKPINPFKATQKDFDEAVGKQGFVYGISNNDYKKEFYITCFHATSQLRKTMKNPPWSIIAVSNDFKRIKEINIDYEKYETRQITVSNQGFFLKRYKEKNNNYSQYDEFKVDF